MTDRANRVCPVERAGGLDNRIRRWLQNPEKILRPHVKEGMVAMDIGCGPGFFTIDMADLVGESGKVIAVDLQEGMLEKLRVKIRGTAFEDRIIPHKCEADRIGVDEKTDFALAFYCVHEISGKKGFFEEMAESLKPGGRMLVVEPPFHVSKAAFQKTLDIARTAGFELVKRPRVLLSKTAVLERRR